MVGKLDLISTDSNNQHWSLTNIELPSVGLVSLRLICAGVELWLFVTLHLFVARQSDLPGSEHKHQN